MIYGNMIWNSTFEHKKLLSRELPVVHPQHFLLVAKDTLEQVMTEKTTTMISGNIIRARMYGVQKRIIRVAREMMPQHLGYQIKVI